MGAPVHVTREEFKQDPEAAAEKVRAAMMQNVDALKQAAGQ